MKKTVLILLLCASHVPLNAKSGKDTAGEEMPAGNEAIATRVNGKLEKIKNAL